MENEQTQVTTLDAFEDALGGMDPNKPAPDPAATVPAEETVTAPADPAATTTVNPDSDGNQDPAKPNETQEDTRSNQAFAAMRVQNRQLQAAVQKMLQKAGADVSLAAKPEDLLTMLDEADVEAQAEELHVPPELLKRLGYLERQTAQQEAERNYQQALNGFQALQAKHGLDQKGVLAFAQQLQADGIDPFKAPVDLEKEFVYRNLDWITEQKVNKAIQDAIAKQTKAEQHSTTPAHTQGRTGTTVPDAKINTMSQFESFLYEQSRR